MMLTRRDPKITRMVRLAASIAIAAIASGCADFNSIYRTPTLDEGEISVITDAKQRVVTNTKADLNGLYFGWNSPRRIICTEPSPDVAQAISEALTASLTVANTSGASTSNAAGNLSTSVAESVAQLGERLAVIQLLRDEMSDLCRSYSNGAVSATTYTLRLAQLDRKMVTLLDAEMSAGAFGRNLAGAGGQAGGSTKPAGSDAEIAAARKQVETDRGEVATAQSKRDAEAADSAARPEKQRDLDTARANLAQDQEVLALLLVQSSSSFASSTPSSAIGEIAGRPTSNTGEIAREITSQQQQYLDDDDVGVLLAACTASMDLMKTNFNPEKLKDLAALRARISRQVESMQSGTARNNVQDQQTLDSLRADYYAQYIAAIESKDMSAFGSYCTIGGGMLAIEDMVRRRMEMRADLRKVEVDKLKVVTNEEGLRLRKCVIALASSDTALQSVKDQCRKDFIP